MEREDTLSKIHKLLNLAGNNLFSEEAQAARAKADQLMQQYRVEQWELQYLGDVREVEEPVLKTIQMPDWQYGGVDQHYELLSHLRTIFYVTARHAQCEHYLTLQDSSLVGYPADVRYAEMLYTYLFTQMMVKVRPTYDTNLSFEENVVKFKEAGYKWKDAHLHLSPHDPRTPNQPLTKGIGVRYTKIYTNYCELHGLHRTKANPEVYFRGFLEGFAGEVLQMFRELETRMDLEGGIVMVGRAEKVKEAYYTFYPHMRPREVVEEPDDNRKALSTKVRRPRRVKARAWANDAYSAGRQAARSTDLIDRSGQAPREL